MSIAVAGTRLTFYYDGLSRRVGKKTETQSAGSSGWAELDFFGYAYDGWNMVMTVRFTAGTAARVASYVWGPDIGSTGYAGADWQKAGGVGGLLMVLDGVSTATYAHTTGDPTDDDYFPLFDRLGNIIGCRKAAVSTASVDYNNLGATGALYDYDAFGRELRSSGPAADLVPFHFSSKFTDQETGLNYYGYRYYDPQNGRWLNRDPIGEEGGSNIYTFAAGNPTTILDLLGLIEILPSPPGQCNCMGHAMTGGDSTTLYPYNTPRSKNQNMIQALAKQGWVCIVMKKGESSLDCKVPDCFDKMVVMLYKDDFKQCATKDPWTDPSFLYGPYGKSGGMPAGTDIHCQRQCGGCGTWSQVHHAAISPAPIDKTPPARTDGQGLPKPCCKKPH